MKKLILSMVFAFTVLFIYPNIVYADSKTTSQFSINVAYHQTEARTMIDRVNEFRQDSTNAWYWNESDSDKIYCSELGVLQYDYYLEKVAMLRAAEIAVNYGHIRPDDTYYYEMTKSYMGSGENIAAGYADEESVFVAWREDDENYIGQGHRRNMLMSDFNRIGLACAEYQGVKFWVQIFGVSDGNTDVTEANDNNMTVTINVLDDNIVESGCYTDKDNSCKSYVKLKYSLFEHCFINADNEGESEVLVNAEDVISEDNTKQDYIFATTSGETISVAANGKPKILIFFTQDCYWCKQLFTDISKSPTSYDGYDVVAVDINGSDINSISSYASQYSGIPVVFCSGNSGPLIDYLKSKDSNASHFSYGTPYTLFVNADNEIVYGLEGYVTNYDDYAAECFSGSWNDSSAEKLRKKAAEEKKKAENSTKKKSNKPSVGYISKLSVTVSGKKPR